MKKVKSYFKFMAFTGLVFGLCFAIGAGLASYVYNYQEARGDDGEEDEIIEEGERTSILVLGVDARPGEERARSDTMILVTIDPEIDKIAVVSIPRDTRVNVTGTSLDKICAANFVGGPENAVKAVQNLIDTTIDYYVEVDFKGFEKIIDTLGGVTIDVPHRMYKPYEGIDLYPGKQQRLDGKKALGFVRNREYTDGDIERTAYQQEFLRAVADELLKPKTVTRLPALIKDTRKYVNTNISVSTMIKMASWAPGFNKDSIICQTLPGYFYDEYNEEGILEQSYWIVDTTQVSTLVDNMFAGITVPVIQPSPFPSGPPQVADTENKDSKERLNKQRSSLPSPGHDYEPGLDSDNDDIFDTNRDEKYI